MSKRAVIYARVSSDDSDREGRNLAGQLEMGREHAHKRGYNVIVELAEDVKGASGADIDLPQLNNIRQLAKAKGFDVLVVRELDRLSRNLGKQLVIEEELKRHSITIEYVLYDYPNTPEGQLMKNIRASFAEYEREKIKERNMRGKRLRVSSGSVLTFGRTPYGYSAVKDGKRSTLEINEPEARIVRLIFDWFTLERLTLRDIARQLLSMGAPLPANPMRKSTKARIWRHTSVRFILASEVYAGTWHYGKQGKPRTEWLGVGVPAIVSPAQYAAAQTILAENKQRKARASKYEHLLARRIVCSVCNKPLFAFGQYNSAGRFYRYYVCSRGDDVHGNQPRCGLGYVNAEKTDALIWDWLKSILLEPKRLIRGVKQYQQQQASAVEPMRRQLEITEELLARARREYQDLLDLYLTSKLQRSMLDARAAQYDAEIASLEQQRDKLAASVEGATLTAERVSTLLQFANAVRQKLDYADDDFSKRKWIVETLNVSATVSLENGQKVLDAACIIDAQKVVLGDTASV